MMEVLAVYLWMQLPVFHGTLVGLAMVLLGITAISLGAWNDARTQERAFIWARRGKRCLAGAVLTAFIVTMMPSQLSVAAMVATYYAVAMAGSPEAGKVVNIMRATANKYLDAELKNAKK